MAAGSTRRWLALEERYWEAADSEAHEWYDQATGEITAYERVLTVLKGES